MYTYAKTTAGFTLIEMIVSLALFSLVVTMGVGSMVILINSNRELRTEQNAMTSLVFAMDSMSREIRTGYNYYCSSFPENYAIDAAHSNIIHNPFSNQEAGQMHPSQDEVTPERTRNCPNGRGSSERHGISFFEGGNSLTGPGVNRIAYIYDEPTQAIWRRIGNAPVERITPPIEDVRITNADFIVTGTSRGDGNQPTVVLKVTGETPDGVSFNLQTRLTQRILDIN